MKNKMKNQNQMVPSRKAHKNVVVVATLIASLAISPCFAAPPAITQAVTPGTVSYQGHVQDANGAPYDNGVYGIEFRLYDDASAGNLLWAASYKPYLKSGFFNVILGQTGVGESTPEGVTPLFPEVADFWKGVWLDPNAPTKERYLGMTIVDELGTPVVAPQESFPRQQLLASPYSVQAQFAQQADSANRSLGNFAVATNLTVGASAQVAGQVTADSFSGNGSIPLGGIIMWSGTTVPEGWALCNGVKVGAIQTPDLRGRFVLGSGSGPNLTPRTLGQIGGTEKQALQVDELPPHKHDNKASSASAGQHSHGYKSGYGNKVGIADGQHATSDLGRRHNDNDTTYSGSHTHTIAMDNASTGSGLPHNNMPPFYTLAFIMRVK